MKMLLIWLSIIRDVAITVFLFVLFFASIHKSYQSYRDGYYFKLPVEVRVVQDSFDDTIEIMVRN